MKMSYKNILIYSMKMSPKKNKRIYSTVLLTLGPRHPLDTHLLGGNRFMMTRRISASKILPEGASPYQ